MKKFRRVIGLMLIAGLVYAFAAGNSGCDGSMPPRASTAGTYFVRGVCGGVEYSARIQYYPGVDTVITGVSTPVTSPNRLYYRKADGLGGAWSGYTEITNRWSSIAFYGPSFYNTASVVNTNWPGTALNAGTVEVRVISATFPQGTNCSVL
ncbi:MAG: hypothetical protein ACOYNI_07535 [Acidimicrobiia bacterium]